LKLVKYISIFLFLIFAACSSFDGDVQPAGRLASIEPDYTGVTIPPNIAPLNFIIREEGEKFNILVTGEKSSEKIEITSGNGKIIFPMKAWKKLLGENVGSEIRFELKIKNREGFVTAYEPFFMVVANEPIDPYLAYRLIPPGYYSWSHIRIMQRCLENFNETPVVDNAILDKNCINCHSFAGNDPERFMVHVRGSKGGTYFMDQGEIKRTDPKIESMPGSATYPSWHPGGRFIAYSSNQVRQSFYAGSGKSIEVFDLAGSMVVYDTRANKIISVNEEDTTNYLRTFPGWSNDGKYLYYCRALNTMTNEPGMVEITSVRHDLVRKSFDEATSSFGATEVVFNASADDKSVSFPRISPDGKYLVFTLADFGTFPIWHKEADLYSIELGNGKVSKMDLNSDFAESYHSWSTNGRWLVFSSKRSDGRSTRPYFAWIDENGRSAKPFILPQKDPEYYHSLIESFNIPEFVSGKIKAGPRDFARAAKLEALKSESAPQPENARPDLSEKVISPAVTPWPVHQ
jgi:Tol biopolymer transport system component